MRFGRASSAGRPIRLRASGRAILLGGALALLVPSAAFGRFGSSISHNCDTTIYSECVADSQYVSVSIWVVGSYGTQTRAAMAYYSSSAVPRIVMTEFYPSPPNYADVQVSTVNTSTVALAWTQCWNGAIYGGSDSAHTRWCIPQGFSFNTRWEPSYYPTDAKKQYIACHELGHTFGLQHPKSSEPQATCMVSARMGSSPWVPTYNYISTTEKNQIELYYGPSHQVSP